MINYTKHFIDKKDVDSVIKSLKGQNLTQGITVKKFEDALSKYFGSNSAVVVSNATMALYLLGIALKWKKGDHIICSPISFLSASNAALNTGAKPEFVDVDIETGNIKPKLIERKIKDLKKKNKRIKAIIVVDYGGLPADWLSLNKLAKRYKLTLINDNCHAMGARYKNDKKYACKFADYVVQSYHAAKNLTTGEGGSVISNHKDIIDKIKILRNHGIFKNGYSEPWMYKMKFLSYNARITDFQCALGISQLKKLDKVIKKKTKLANVYYNFLDRNSNLQLPEKKNDRASAYHLFPLKINFRNLKISKKKFFSLMKKKYKINLQVHYIPIYNQPYYNKFIGVKKSNYKNSNKFYNLVLSLPIYYNMNLNLAKKVAKIINKTLIKYAK